MPPHDQPSDHRREVRRGAVRAPPRGSAAPPGARPLLRRREPAAPGPRRRRALAARARADRRDRRVGRAASPRRPRRPHRRRPRPPTASATCRPMPPASARDGSPAFTTPRPALVARARPPRRRPRGARRRRDARAGRRRGRARRRRLRAAAGGGGDGGGDADRARPPSGTRRPTTSPSCGRRARRTRWRAPSSAPPTSPGSTSWSRAWPPPPSSRAAPSASTTAGRGATRSTRASRRRTGSATLLAEQVFRVPQSHVRVVTGRRRRQLRDAQRHLPRAAAGAVGVAAARAAGEVDVRPPRGLRHRRARSRQCLDGRARARRGRDVPGAARRHHPQHRRLPHAAQRGPGHQQCRRRGRRVHDARHPRARPPVSTRT